MRALSAFRLLLLASWLGAAVFFIAVAQSAFAVLPSREAAGGLVGRTLAILNYSGLGISIIALLTSFIVPIGTRKIVLWVERVLLVIFGLACAIEQFVITWWMLLLRTQMGRPIDEVAVDDPLRIQFNNLHEYSSWLMLTAMAATLIAFVIVSLRPTTAAKKVGIDDLDFQKQFKI
jgi:hypothetical protein